MQQQQLAELSQLLQPVGLSHMVDQHIMYPGHRRTQLVQAMMHRLLGGLEVEDIKFAGAELLQGIAVDERFAEKCHSILKVLGVTATPEQLRGCSGQQEHDTAPLLHMARLLNVMKAQGVASTRSAARQPLEESLQEPSDAAAYSGKLVQLLTAATAQWSKLISDTTQLFPSDMNDALKAYSDQGALVQLPTLCQHAMQRAQQLQQTLQQLLAAGASSCEGAGGQQWQQLVQDMDAALQRQLQDMAHFDALYQQELSVWTGAANMQQQQQQPMPDQQQPWAGLQQGRDASSAAGSAESAGRMARSLMCAYQELQAVMEAVGTIMMQHQALKDVPAAMLQEQKAQHFKEACTLRMYGSAVRQQPPV